MLGSLPAAVLADRSDGENGFVRVAKDLRRSLVKKVVCEELFVRRRAGE
jgi:hypothetical protein